VVTEATAASLLRKLGEFSGLLDPGERELFAALIGPGVAWAIGSVEVAGFASQTQESDRLARALAELVRRDQVAEAGDSDPRPRGSS